MIEGSLGRRYAKAILILAEQKNSVDAFLQEIQSLAPYFAESSPLLVALNNPALSLVAKKSIINAVISKVQISTEIGNMLRILVERKKVSIFDSIVREFRQLADEKLGQLRITVQSPQKIDAASEAKLQQVFASKTGKKIILTTQVGPDLLGGIVVKVDDKVYDGSLKTQLNKLRTLVEKQAV